MSFSLSSDRVPSSLEGMLLVTEEMNNKILTKEEKACEKHFELNTRR
jgi:hypothetical protein